MFDNLYVRKVINLKRYVPKVINTAIEDVDSDVSNNSEIQTYFGIPVFKYGSTTKYTKGHLNGIKLVYWLDGAIHSSEFIVNSIEANSSFASGGDSGSWILTKLDDIEDNSKGLGFWECYIRTMVNSNSLGCLPHDRNIVAIRRSYQYQMGSCWV